MDDGRAARAAGRRASALPGRIVRLGETKGDLHAGLSNQARLAGYWRLIQRAWKAAGRDLPAPIPRDELPGEVFRVVSNG